MKKILSTLAFGLTLSASQLANANEFTTFLDTGIDDAKYVATAPARWEKAEWENLGWAGAAVLGTAIVADVPVRDFMRQQPRNNSFLNSVENFGTTYAFATMGAFYAVGLATDNQHSVQVAEDAVIASAISATLNQTIKVTVNRSRPRDNVGTSDFQGFTGLNNNSSFPSGHTTEAFTLAAVIATSYEEDWVSYASYSVASLVGVARMYNDAHFASDVVTSAIIGTYIGRTVVKHNKHSRKNSFVLLPELMPDGGAGIRVVGLF
jgi:membrane-associated phospholipid phosphatase